MATKIPEKHDLRKKPRGNVFSDIGFANPEREQLKAHLTLQIYRIIKSRGLIQVEAGAILGIKQPPRFGPDALPFKQFFDRTAAELVALDVAPSTREDECCPGTRR
ncbi:MAG TPA: XRE family transcriptional regulator [Verrucomicrobiae bacterium]|nr:XRE family transcriptional regulator [Verrucomicrobiae bacterium]